MRLAACPRLTETICTVGKLVGESRITIWVRRAHLPAETRFFNSLSHLTVDDAVSGRDRVAAVWVPKNGVRLHIGGLAIERVAGPTRADSFESPELVPIVRLVIIFVLSGNFAI